MTYLVPVACAAILLITFAFAGYPLVAGRGRLAIQSDRGRLGMQLLRKRDQLYAAIKELDFDRSLGKVLEEDYASQRRGLDGEAVAVLAQLDQLERRTNGKSSVVWQIEQDVAALQRRGVPESSPACPGCGAPSLKEHRFCPECGHRFVSDRTDP